jgi:hypothetical protein
MASQNYTLGRGRVYFDQYASGTFNTTGERYIGNTPEFALSVESEDLTHYSADEGLRVKDDSVVLEVNYAGTFITDEISSENLAFFFLGSAAAVTVTGGAADEETMDVQKGLYYQLGVSDTSPSGVRKISDVVVSAATGGATPYTVDEDYTVDLDLGRIYIVPGGTIANDATIFVNYDIDASTREQVVTSGTTVEGAIRFVSYNAKGTKRDYFLPYVKLSPSGDFALKGSDWQQISFNVEVLKKSDAVEALYIDGRAA